jgi:hypothetical protein
MEAKIKPRLAAGDGPLKVPRQPAIAAKPGEAQLDDPSPGRYLKTLGLVGSLDQRPLPAPSFKPAETSRMFLFCAIA